jgi:putative transposase
VQISPCLGSQVSPEVIIGKVLKRLGEIVRELCRQKGIEMIEGHALVDHLYVCLSFPSQYSISDMTRFLKGKSAIRLHREFVGRGTTGKHFWVGGYYVSTVGYNEQEAREYIRNQEKLDKEQMELKLE